MSKCKNCSIKLIQRPKERNYEFSKRQFHSKGCATSFRVKGLIGNKKNTWKNGKSITKAGYIVRYVSPKKYVLDHRYIIEKELGRKLSSNEDVHHIDGDKTNNSFENLMILSRQEHLKLEHRTGNYKYDIASNNLRKAQFGKNSPVFFNRWIHKWQRRSNFV